MYQVKFTLQGSKRARTKNADLEILFQDKNQVDDKIEWGLGEGFLSFHSSFVC